MTLIVLGLALWWAAHLWKRMAPASRARFGEPGKGIVTALVLAGVVLMVVGFRGSVWLGIDGAEFVPVWDPPRFLVHVNNLLMLFAFYLYAASGMKTRITRVIRHPQLTAVKTWAVAHLLVNGDLASIVLFGGILAWAVVSVILINKAEPRGPLPEPAPVGKEIGAVVGAVVVMGVVMLVHNWLGVPPWG
ncbi:NnrU family protein [Rhodobacter sp. SY28-1]|uniref:NnrU family protein n=1 Tax=Rhodobacter sp. SY28-1 TaxID=2562317 RepID=UPI0010BFDCF4|nr:NnrU family protein [Rhodobacter sp. SY28-1]